MMILNVQVSDLPYLISIEIDISLCVVDDLLFSKEKKNAKARSCPIKSYKHEKPQPKLKVSKWHFLLPLRN